ncbi:thioesterase domain-containing protein [Streptomyces longwoodensis]|uniref:thioesterase II family protein n=1 Tax=Streptomyces longwoodensis TaxID=68231 RepID=UPI002E821B30|nr:thioesterase domain-containing protein [Streptomyces longwoodensis]WUC55901.1 thioesterase domain-containing protein [Streptomyces longwoodensis]WUC61979.1 thioesterase domain-containing protein [Streptomyces longwoodensis]
MSDERPVRLHCFAHSADGVSVFDRWSASTGTGVEVVPVVLPGGAGRGTGPRPATHAGLLAQLLPRFTDPGPGPYVLYGHGLGAMIAFTLTRALHEAGLPGPALLAVASLAPPCAPLAAQVRAMSDAELLDVLGGHGTVPAASDEGIMLRAMLPVLRADLELAQALDEAALTPSAAGPLNTPVLVVASQDNPLAPAAVADGWRQWTQGPVRVRTVPGRHFFVRGARELPRLLGRACRVTRRLVPEPAPVG